MPQQLPQIPQVDKQTSYQKLKAIVEKLREEFLRAYLFDSASVTVVDNPGKGRSAEVNFPNQGIGGFNGDRNMSGEADVPAGSWVDVDITVAEINASEAYVIMVNTGEQNDQLVLSQQWTEAGKVVLRFTNRNAAMDAAWGSAPTIYVKAFNVPA